MPTDDPTWEEGPWIVERKTTYLIEGCGPDKARRAVTAYTTGELEMLNGETWPSKIEHLNTSSTITPAGDGPFDLDTEIKQMKGE